MNENPKRRIANGEQMLGRRRGQPRPGCRAQRRWIGRNRHREAETRQQVGTTREKKGRQSPRELMEQAAGRADRRRPADGLVKHVCSRAAGRGGRGKGAVDLHTEEAASPRLGQLEDAAGAATEVGEPVGRPYLQNIEHERGRRGRQRSKGRQDAGRNGPRGPLREPEARGSDHLSVTGFRPDQPQPGRPSLAGAYRRRAAHRLLKV